MTFPVPFMLDVKLMKRCGMHGPVDNCWVGADGGRLCAAVCVAVAQGRNTRVLVLIFCPNRFIWSSQHCLKYISGVLHAS